MTSVFFRTHLSALTLFSVNSEWVADSWFGSFHGKIYICLLCYQFHHMMAIFDGMRTISEYENIIDLWGKGFNNCQISRQLNIPRCTVRDFIKGYKNDSLILLTRKINLNSILDKIINQHTAEADLLGLFHSDGSRYKSTAANKYYYNFVQKSEDITNLFIWCSNILGIKFHVGRYPGKNKIQIYDARSIEYLDTFAGNKT